MKFTKVSFNDLIDFNYTLKEEMDYFIKFPKRRISFLKSIIYFFSVGFKSIKDFSIAKLKDNRYLFVQTSANHRTVIEPIFSNINSASLLGLGADVPVSKFSIFVYSLLYMPVLLFRGFNQSGYNKQIYTSCFHLLLQTYGQLVYWDRFFTKYSFKTVVFSNDHLSLYRTLNYIARIKGIDRVYIQHSGISNKFPALDYSYTFLDGEISMNMYSIKTPIISSKVYLYGSPRFDSIFKVRSNRIARNAVGLSLNSLDDLGIIAGLLRKIRLSYDGEIFIRFHPGFNLDRVKKAEELFEEFKIISSIPSQCSLGEFLANIKIHLAGVSFIHFEAILSGIDSKFVKSSDYAFDNYGFLKSGFIREIESFDFTSKEYPINNIQEDYLRSYIGNYDELAFGESSAIKIANKIVAS